MNRPQRSLLWASIFLIGTPLEAAVQHPSLGVNIGEIRRYSMEHHFIDEMKRAEVVTQTASTWNTQEKAKVDWDENGWPRSLEPVSGSASFDRITYLLFGGDYSGWDVEAPDGGEFLVYYEGEGELSYGHGAKKLGSCGTNCDRISIQPKQQSLASISITQTNSSNHLRNIQVIHSGGLCDRNPLEHHDSAASCSGSYETYAQLRNQMIYHPDFLKGLKPFGLVRFMDFQSTNHFPRGLSHSQLLALSELDWNERSKVTDAQWNNGDIGGAPLGAMLELVNTLDIAPWFDMPTLASDDYVRGFAQKTLAELDNDQRVYVEYGNEIWNSGFPASKWVEAKGKQQWPQEGDGFKARLNWFGKRTAEMCQIWKDVWGSEADRVTCAMGGQAANSWVLDSYSMECPLWANDASNPDKGQACGQSVDAIAVAPYFGGYVGQAANKSKLEELATRGEEGLKVLFTELRSGGVLPSSHEGGALRRSSSWTDASIAVANKWNLPLLGYEGGQHLAGVSGVQDSQAVTDLFRRANRDERMGELYQEYLEGWQKAGAQTMALYKNVSPYTKWGQLGAA